MELWRRSKQKIRATLYGERKMKQTKDAGLVSCGLEEYLINELDRETSKKKHKKFESEVLKEKQLMGKLMAK